MFCELNDFLFLTHRGRGGCPFVVPPSVLLSQILKQDPPDVMIFCFQPIVVGGVPVRGTPTTIRPPPRNGTKDTPPEINTVSGGC